MCDNCNLTAFVNISHFVLFIFVQKLFNCKNYNNFV